MKRIYKEVTRIKKKSGKKVTWKKWFKNITWIRDQGSRYGHFSSSTKDVGSGGATYYLCICFGCQNVHKFATMYVHKKNQKFASINCYVCKHWSIAVCLFSLKNLTKCTDLQLLLHQKLYLDQGLNLLQFLSCV